MSVQERNSKVEVGLMSHKDLRYGVKSSLERGFRKPVTLFIEKLDLVVSLRQVVQVAVIHFESNEGCKADGLQERSEPCRLQSAA